VQIIFQKATGKPVRRIRSLTAKDKAELELQFGEVEAREIRDTALNQMPFDQEMPLEAVFDLPSTFCSECGRGSMERPAAELTVIRRHHRDLDAGAWDFLCPEHSGGSVRSSASSSKERGGRARKVICTNCFLEVPVGGVCQCGEPAPVE